MRYTSYILHNLTEKKEVDDADMWKVICYQIQTENLTQSFIRTAYSNLMNPAGMTPGEIKALGLDFIKVPMDVYDKYIAIITGESKASLRILERQI